MDSLAYSLLASDFSLSKEALDTLLEHFIRTRNQFGVNIIVNHLTYRLGFKGYASALAKCEDTTPWLLHVLITLIHDLEELKTIAKRDILQQFLIRENQVREDIKKNPQPNDDLYLLYTWNVLDCKLYS